MTTTAVRHHATGRAVRRLAGAVGASALLALGATACGSDGKAAAERRIPAQEATGLALVDGRLVIGERLSGRIRSVDLADPSAAPVVVAQLDDLDADPPQGGLLGIVATDDATVAVSSTAADGHLVVDEVAIGSGTTDRRWQGPTSEEQANGGRMAVLADGTLAIGIGDLLDPDRSDDPDAPNGKLLALDDDGDARPLAGPFNNPFALVGDGDVVWIADNAPGARAERLLRVEGGAITEIASWTDTRVPAGLAVLPDGRLAMCSYVTGELALIDPDDPGDASGEVIAEDCRYGVVALPDGGLAYAAEDEVVLLDPPG